ncbi:MAG TPA: hypothetical protein VGO22_22910 [Pseudorhizobium sp.]|jgi:hypothetical protein|nr:hypothetical protein [Pseudorhizobium sp.]
MRDIEGVEEIVASLAPHLGDIEKEFHVINNRFLNLIGSDHDTLGRVLRSHLVIEHFLNDFLELHYRIDNIGAIRLSFYQKACMLPSVGSAAAFAKPGILEVNSIRNKYAHNIGYDLNQASMEAVNEVLRLSRPEVDFDTRVDQIEAFTATACAFLSAPLSGLREVYEHAFKNIRVRENEDAASESGNQ